MTVYGVARDADALARLSADCGIIPVVADVRDTARIAEALSGAAIDVLVNNAGMVSSVRPLDQQDSDEISETIAVNLIAPLHLMHLLVPGMMARGHGHIVNITSTAAHHVFTGTAAYGAAKAGLSHAGSVMRYDLAGSGVRLTEIAPGRVETDIYLKAFGGEQDRLKQTLYTGVRALTPIDVADAVVLALSLPEHVDVSIMELTPTDQAPGGHVMRPPSNP
jgi:NADP-dependent 3-hydroxy acid dehydrogenase YdfG